MTNKPNNKVEEKVEEFIKSYEGILPPEAIEYGAEWYRQALASSYEQGVRDVVGNIGAGLLAQHSPQVVLDAYFDVANKELEKYETDN